MYHASPLDYLVNIIYTIGYLSISEGKAPIHRGGAILGKKSEPDWLDRLLGTGHTTNKQKKNWDKHSGANRNPGTGKPNSKSNRRERLRKNGG